MMMAMRYLYWQSRLRVLMLLSIALRFSLYTALYTYRTRGPRRDKVQKHQVP
jgi:hypothetical protein